MAALRPLPAATISRAPPAVLILAGATLEARRLYYHSLRFVSWSSSRYLAQATRDLEAVLEPGTGQQHCSTDC